MPRRLPLLLGICWTTTLYLATSQTGSCQKSGMPAQAEFTRPPDSARPWVWGHWLHGNVDKPCITRELEAMKRAGLCGMTMFDVAQPGIPAGPHPYMSPGWQELFAWQIREAKRLGLEVMSHLGPGYSGSGGPWIPHELASQRIYESATRHRGGTRFSGTLPKPEIPGSFFRDVAVIAVREIDGQPQPGIEDFELKRLVWLNFIRWKGVVSAPPEASLPSANCIRENQVVDLTRLTKNGGQLDWDAPPGNWTILRFGHGWTGQNTLPATPEGQGPECDKLNKRGIQAHFDHVMKRMITLAGPEAGKTFHSFFIDSWEAGGQNWTEEMPAEFERRRGYSPIPFLPVLSGRVIGDLQTSERFLYDLRLTVSELVTQNFWAELRRLCNANGMRLAAQPYITTGNDFDAANHADEPMGEFWNIPNVPGNDYSRSMKIASSAANLNGLRIVGAEAFTSTDQERWLSHPATLKAQGDRMFCLGANRFQIHRFAMQRFPRIAPGMTMGKWGQHYDSTQTWWEWSKPWHDYLARCQYMLRCGPVTTDVLVLTPEEPLWRYEHEAIPGYDFDVCGPNAFERIETLDGKPGIKDGPIYQLISAKHTGRMSVGRLRKLRNLVASGAALLGEPPQTTPGLADLPESEEELKSLISEIWGCHRESDRTLGKGRVFRGISPQEALHRLDVSEDFKGPDHLSWIHRKSGDMDIYFVANPTDQTTQADCYFRITGKSAEIWDPETGAIRPLELGPPSATHTPARFTLAPSGSTFIVFRTPPATETLVPISHSKEPAYKPGRKLNGPWTVRFPASDVKDSLNLEPLISWTKHPDPRVRHFSGTATYTCGFNLESMPDDMLLDLGRVEIMARVKLNGTDLGILWKPPYQTDISRHIRVGSNQLEIDVVNLWVNRMIGDESLPTDAKRDPRGVLTEWPEWLLNGSGSPTGRKTFATYPLWKKDEELLPSGLIGPVILR